MKVTRYSRWDGSQAEFSLDARRALDALSDLLLEGLEVDEALEWMQRVGFEMAGLDMRVMGVDELISELHGELDSLYRRYQMDSALAELRRRFEEILDRELRALGRAHGYESARMNDFLERRYAESAGLAEAIERFRDYAFADAAAGVEYRELLDELERLRELEQFLRERGERFRGSEAADYQTAQGLRERIEQIERMARDLAAGRLEAIDADPLRELLGGRAGDSLILLRDLRSSLARAGYLRKKNEAWQLTPRAIRQIGAQAMAEVYGALKKARPGAHEMNARGLASPRPDETRPYAFGDALDLDVVRTILNSLRRHALAAPGRPLQRPIPLALSDFEIREADYSTETTTVLLLDMSWSMSWAGRFPAAKRVALALDHLVRARFPRDHFFVVGFSTRARELPIRELPEVSWDAGDPFTNLQEGLRVAQRLIARNPSPSPQILVITDGQPTAYFRGEELRVEWPSGFGGVSPHAVAATLREVRRVSRGGITINTFMLDDAPELVGFVERMTQINRGRAFFTSPRQLGSYLMVDYISQRRSRRS